MELLRYLPLQHLRTSRRTGRPSMKQLQSKTSDLAHRVQIIQLRPRPLHVSNIKCVRFAGGFNEPRNTHSLHFEAVGQTETAQKWDAFGDVFSPVSLDATFVHE